MNKIKALEQKIALTEDRLSNLNKMKTLLLRSNEKAVKSLLGQGVQNLADDSITERCIATLKPDDQARIREWLAAREGAMQYGEKATICATEIIPVKAL